METNHDKKTKDTFVKRVDWYYNDIHKSFNTDSSYVRLCPGRR